MERKAEKAQCLLREMSQSLEIDSSKLARVSGQFITPEGNQVYLVRLGGRSAYVTVPEE
jgi:hypothetical protein